MFYYLSKFFSFFTQPFGIFTFLMGIWYFNRTKKTLRHFNKLAFVFLYLSSTGAMVEFAAKAWEVPLVDINTITEHDMAIVLTGGIASEYLSDKSKNYLGNAADRIWQVAHLYKKGKIKSVLISGGDGKVGKYANNLFESDKAKDFLIDVGVPAEKIFQEKNSLNTHENAKYSKIWLNKLFPNTEPKLILVTSSWHMKRAGSCFDKVGLKTLKYGANPIITNMKISWFDFSPDAIELHKMQLFIKEWIGYLVYWVMGYV